MKVKFMDNSLRGLDYLNVHPEEYRKVIVDVVDNPKLSIVWNLNVGHATPRCIIPFGVAAMVDVDAQRINFTKK